MWECIRRYKSVLGARDCVRACNCIWGYSVYEVTVYMRASSVYDGAQARWAEEYKLPLFHTSIAHLNNRPLFATFPSLITLQLFLPIISSTFFFFKIQKGVYTRLVGGGWKTTNWVSFTPRLLPLIEPWYRHSGSLLLGPFWHSSSVDNILTLNF